ncbi:MAG TPA: hypothetical protein VKR26_13835 [Terriglobales bacterium]|nr:hypothetical protein [Terriglobales bacterium]
MRTILQVWKVPYLDKYALALLMTVFLCTPPVHAQTDEIQVYDAEIEPPGIFNLMIHSNFTPLGRTTPVFSGAIIADHSFNGTAEWAYGVTPWFEQGLYLPVYTIYSTGQGATINGFKLRELFVRPHAHDHKLFYGANFEFSVNASYWEDRTITSEIRPIVGLHLHPVDLIYNPILDTDYRGGFGNLQYNPAGRVAYNLNDNWAFAVEEYDGFGALHDFVPLHQQFHELWVVTDHSSPKILGINVEAGIGFGLTAGSDKVTLKLMLSRNLNSHRWRP